MRTVCIKSDSGIVLTDNCAYVRILLKSNKAKIISMIHL